MGGPCARYKSKSTGMLLMLFFDCQNNVNSVAMSMHFHSMQWTIGHMFPLCGPSDTILHINWFLNDHP